MLETMILMAARGGGVWYARSTRRKFLRVPPGGRMRENVSQRRQKMQFEPECAIFVAIAPQERLARIVQKLTISFPDAKVETVRFKMHRKLAGHAIGTKVL